MWLTFPHLRLKCASAVCRGRRMRPLETVSADLQRGRGSLKYYVVVRMDLSPEGSTLATSSSRSLLSSQVSCLAS